MWPFACSGPGALAAIRGNIAFAVQQAAFVGLLFSASLMIWIAIQRRMRYPAVCLLLLFLHPAWTLSANRGDCGRTMANLAVWTSVIASVAVVMQGIHAVRGVRKSHAHSPVDA